MERDSFLFKKHVMSKKILRDNRIYPTVRSLAPICSSTTSTTFLEPCFKQSHRARHKLIKRKDFPVRFLGTWWLLLYQQASLKWNAVLCRKWSVVKSQHLYPVWAPLKTFNDFFFAFGGNTYCGSASLKLCICIAASP